MKKLSNKASLWSSYSGTFKKNIQNYNEVNSIRGVRYFGPSQMSLFKLLIHSFSIVAVFRNRVLALSVFLFASLYYLGVLIKFDFLFLQILIILFNICINVVSLRENKIELENSHLNIDSIDVLTH